MAKVTIGGRTYEVEVRGDTVVVDGHEYPVTIRDENPVRIVTAGGVPYRVELPPADQRQSGMTVKVDYREFTVEYEGTLGGRPVPQRRQPAGGGGGGGAARPAAKGSVPAPIAGRVLSIRVKAGDEVKAGDVLLILEAMKMENEIKAPADGVVKEVLVAEGARVAEGDGLVVVE